MPQLSLGLRRILLSAALSSAIAAFAGKASAASPASGGSLAPGLYVQVIDGLIHLNNPSGAVAFSAGQFGFVPTSVQPPIIVPQNPGVKFTPPPAFSPSSSANKVLVTSDKTLPTGMGDLTATSDKSVSTIAVVGGSVTVNVITGQLTFTGKDGTKSTLNAGNSAIIEGGAVKTLMATTAALTSGNTAFAEVTQHSLLQAVAAVAALARTNPGDAPMNQLLTNLVTQVSTLAANAGNTALVANVVAFAVSNGPPNAQAAIMQASQDGIANSTASAAVKSSLAATIESSADAGAKSRLAAPDQTQLVPPETTPANSIDPSLAVSASGE